MAPATVHQTTSKSPNLVRRLHDLIQQRQLQPGEKLPPIRELATLFDVKAGAVRDALLGAQGKGLLKLLPRTGAFVQAIENLPSLPSASVRTATRLREQLARQDQNLLHVLDAREMLELETISRATQRRELHDLFPLRRILEEMNAIPVDSREANFVRLDIQFHLEIARQCGNTVLTSMLCALMEELEPYLLQVTWSTERRRRTDHSHAVLYSALVDGDDAAARNAMRCHCRQAYNSLLNEIRQPPAIPESSHNGSSGID